MFGWLTGNQTQAAADPSGNPAVTTPGTGAPTVDPVGQGGFMGLGENFANNAGTVLSGVQALGSLWNSYQANKLAKEQIGLQREAFQTNLANQKKTYNTALEDRIRSRYNTEGRSSGEADAYVNQHKL